MFLDFLFYLRAGGVKVSLNEWLELMEALYKGLHRQSIDGFFVLCRALIVKKETDIDKFEELFYTFFEGIESERLEQEISELREDKENARTAFEENLVGICRMAVEQEGLLGQNKARSFTSRGIGAGAGTGDAIFGMGGKSIIHERGDRKFRDWRTDCSIESRQFQMAFRLLREMSRKLDASEKELDILTTIDRTCRRGGILDICMQPPRKNRLKVMVLIDSGGSMQPYEKLCSLLFQSLHKANTFADLKIYYFHNCIESKLYKTPSIDDTETVKSDWILRNISSEYKVIFVGDAEMSLSELIDNSYGSSYSSDADGITWLRRFKEKYKKSIWLHPQEREENILWMAESFVEIEKVFPMYRLSIDGLKDGMYKLLKE